MSKVERPFAARGKNLKLIKPKKQLLYVYIPYDYDLFPILKVNIIKINVVKLIEFLSFAIVTQENGTKSCNFSTKQYCNFFLITKFMISRIVYYVFKVDYQVSSILK